MAEPWQRLPFEEQIAFLAERVNVPTDSYRDVSGAEHDAAFVVAGAKGAVLNDFRSAVDRAIATGQTLEQFRQEFDSIVERTGWTFRGGSAWRANVIWDTNLRTSYAAGRYEQMQQVTTSRPYWQWRHGGSAHPRPQHLALDGKVFRHDDPFWSSFGSPPQGYGCRCSVFTLSDRDLERRGLAAEPGPQLGDRLPIPDLPGQTTAMNPPAGWGHLHGSSGPQHRAQLLDAVTRRLDPALAAQVRREAAAFEARRQRLSQDERQASLLTRLREQGENFTEAAVRWVDEMPDGKLIWLEDGGAGSGWTHIQSKASDFEGRGVNPERLESLIRESLVRGRPIGPQSPKGDRIIYEVEFDGQVQYVGITVGSNGFVVGANPGDARVIRRLLGDNS
jgi:SPP1 gp7 family putative phage head morphogenesis protein